MNKECCLCKADMSEDMFYSTVDTDEYVCQKCHNGCDIPYNVCEECGMYTLNSQEYTLCKNCGESND